MISKERINKNYFKISYLITHFWMIKKRPSHGKIVILTEVYFSANHEQHLLTFSWFTKWSTPDGTGAPTIHATSAELYILHQLFSLILVSVLRTSIYVLSKSKSRNYVTWIANLTKLFLSVYSYPPATV